MTEKFDIFQLDELDRPIWVATATDLRSARLRVQDLMKTLRCDFLIFFQKSGAKIRIKFDEQSYRGESR